MFESNAQGDAHALSPTRLPNPLHQHICLHRARDVGKCARGGANVLVERALDVGWRGCVSFVGTSGATLGPSCCGLRARGVGTCARGGANVLVDKDA